MDDLQRYAFWTGLTGFCVPLIIFSIKRGVIFATLLWTILLICDLFISYKYYLKLGQ